ncbi:hypothetical protein [Stieleria sp.]|uniref:hypothetical protein n=1 Tax=Stieleria sp. TaxID=2795976 RepID=UPI0035694EDD
MADSTSIATLVTRLVNPLIDALDHAVCGSVASQSETAGAHRFSRDGLQQAIRGIQARRLVQLAAKSAELLEDFVSNRVPLLNTYVLLRPILPMCDKSDT